MIGSTVTEGVLQEEQVTVDVRDPANVWSNQALATSSYRYPTVSWGEEIVAHGLYSCSLTFDLLRGHVSDQARPGRRNARLHYQPPACTKSMGNQTDLVARILPARHWRATLRIASSLVRMALCPHYGTTSESASYRTLTEWNASPPLRKLGPSHSTCNPYLYRLVWIHSHSHSRCPTSRGMVCQLLGPLSCWRRCVDYACRSESTL